MARTKFTIISTKINLRITPIQKVLCQFAEQLWQRVDELTVELRLFLRTKRISKMKSVLFVCTGNYYRSRFAEIYFNYLATRGPFHLAAFSRGLEVFLDHNPDELSPFTKSYLQQLAIPLPQPVKFPEQFEKTDFEKADHTILMDVEEHLPMMQKYHPVLASKVEYWDFPDIQFQQAENILPLLKEKVESYIHGLSS